MKKTLLLFVLLLGVGALANAQTQLGAAEKKMNDALCDCLSKIDFKAINTSKLANKAFVECFSAYPDLLMAVADEKGVDLTDNEATGALGEKIGKNLASEKCPVFMKLALLMAGDEDAEAIEQTTGIFKRIDNKGFNYIVITANNNESSFLWLRQFPESDRFIDAGTKLTGKKLTISWREIEVYLPSAKGYYKMKEITGIEIL